MFLTREDAVAHYARTGFKIEFQSENEIIMVRDRKVGIFWNLVLSILTSGIWAIVWIVRLATKRKVIRLSVGTDGIWREGKGHGSEFAAASAASRPSKFASLPKGVKWGAAGLALVLLIVGVVINVNARAKQTQIASVTASEIYKAVSKDLGSDFCAEVTKSWKEDASLASARKHAAAAARSAKTLTIWSGKGYVAKNAWVNETTETSNDFVAAVDGKVLSRAEASLKTQKLEILSQALVQNSTAFAPRIRDAALESCNLKKQYDENLSLIGDFQIKKVLISSLASQYPWYPKGYEEIYSFPGFAYKNGAGNSCNYGASCASFGLVSRDACPSMLYAEVNMLDSSGAVVDWSNDTVQGVAAGQVARMAANSYNDNFRSWEFTKINCY